MKKAIKKAVIPVAGLGTRFLPASKSIPKEMMPIFNKPIIHYIVEEALEAGIETLIFVTSRSKHVIEDYFDINYELESHLTNNNKEQYKEIIAKGIPQAGKVFFTRQQKPLGLGHAISCAKDLIQNESFAILLPDEFLFAKKGCLSSMVDLYNTTDAEVIIASKEVDLESVSSYGIFDLEEVEKGLLKIKNVIEKPSIKEAPSNNAIIGRYILHSDIFTHLERAEKGVGGEIQLTDSIEKIISKYPSYAYRFEGKRFDCGNPLGLLEASINMALEDNNNKDYIKRIIKDT